MTNTKKLLHWYDENHRDLPWRNTSDPYKVWLSEIILQQTRVIQGMNYYLNFVEKFPTVFDLARASEDSVLKLWQGLGYYSRARNLHTAAKTIANEFNGIFPSTYKELIKLKGVGPYTAAAIASIVFDEPTPVIDGNVGRVISRWYAIEEPINSTSGLNQIKSALNKLIDKKQAGKFNQAMMEFGARYCKPRNPDCESCIFHDKCLAFQKQKVSLLPRKKSTLKIKTRFFNYLIITFPQDGTNFTIIKKRSGSDIWKGLYEFPLLESATETPIENLMELPGLKQFVNPENSIIQSISKNYIHQLTHQKINARFIKIQSNKAIKKLPLEYMIVPISSLGDFPIPRLIDKYLIECPL